MGSVFYKGVKGLGLNSCLGNIFNEKTPHGDNRCRQNLMEWHLFGILEPTQHQKETESFHLKETKINER